MIDTPNRNSISGVTLKTINDEETKSIDCSSCDYAAIGFYNNTLYINKIYNDARICIVSGAQCVKTI